VGGRKKRENSYGPRNWDEGVTKIMDKRKGKERRGKEGLLGLGRGVNK